MAEVAAPDGIKLLDERIHQIGIVRQHAVLEVALSLALRAHPRAREVGRAEIRRAPVHDDALEMDARTQHPLHALPEAGIPIEVLAPIRPRFLGVDEPHLDPTPHHPCQHLQERHHVASASIDVHVLDVGGGDPQPFPHLRHGIADHPLVDFTVG